MAFCRHCGNELNEDDSFCRACGTPVGSTGPPVKTKKGGNTFIALIVAAIVIMAAFYAMGNIQTSGDYKITIGVEEFSLCNTDMTVDNGDDSDGVGAEIVFQFSYNGDVKKTPVVNGVQVHAPGTNLKTVATTPGTPLTVSYEVYGSGSVKMALFMTDYDGVAASFGNIEIYDTIDIFDSNAPSGVERPGVSGISFSIDLKPGTDYLEMEGDDLPRGYVELKITVERIQT